MTQCVVDLDARSVAGSLDTADDLAK